MKINIFKKTTILAILFSFVLAPLFLNTVLAAPNTEAGFKTESFKAKVIELIAEEEKEREAGGSYIQQDLKLEAIDGPRKGEEFIYLGISKIEVSDSNVHKVGDKVFVDVFTNELGEETVYLTGQDRSLAMYILIALFALVFIVIGRSKGLKSLLSLVVSFIVILKFILPQILAGRDPFIISLIGEIGRAHV